MPNVTGSKLQHYSDRICFLNALEGKVTQWKAKTAKKMVFSITCQ